MADVERGQLILVTALTIAVSLVALVLLLNTVIYAENLATRGADVGGQDAVEYRGAVVDGVGGAIDAENQLAYDDYDLVSDNVSASIDRVDALLARQHVTRAELVEISNASLTEGTYLAHPEDTGNFSSKDNDSDWQLASNVPATRGFVMTVDRDDVTAGGTAGAFQVVVSNGTHQWIAYVYDAGGITIAVENGSEASPTEVCTAGGSNATIDFTAGTVDGEQCSGLVFGKGVSGSYEIRYANAHEAGGTYEFTVQRDPGTSIQAGFHVPDSGTAPYYGYAVYDATVDLRYHTDALRYTDRVRVAPGESA